MQNEVLLCYPHVKMVVKWSFTV